MARVDCYRNAAIAGIGLVSAAAAIVLLRTAPNLVGVAGFLYFGIGISEWTIGEWGGRLERRIKT